MEKLLCIYGGGTAGVAAGLASAVLLGASLPVALGIAYAVGFGGVAVAASVGD